MCIRDRQGAFDLSGAVDDDKTMLYRLTGVARDGRNEISAIKDDRLFIAPAFTFQPDAGTKLTLLGEYMDSTTGGTWGYINNYGSDGKSIGATRVYGGDSRFNDFEQKQWRIGYEFEHEINDNVTFYSKRVIRPFRPTSNGSSPTIPASPSRTMKASPPTIT